MNIVGIGRLHLLAFDCWVSLLAQAIYKKTVCKDHNLTDCGTRIFEVSVVLGGIRRMA